MLYYVFDTRGKGIEKHFDDVETLCLSYKPNNNGIYVYRLPHDNKCYITNWGLKRDYYIRVTAKEMSLAFECLSAAGLTSVDKKIVKNL